MYPNKPSLTVKVSSDLEIVVIWGAFRDEAQGLSLLESLPPVEAIGVICARKACGVWCQSSTAIYLSISWLSLSINTAELPVTGRESQKVGKLGLCHLLLGLPLSN